MTPLSDHESQALLQGLIDDAKVAAAYAERAGLLRTALPQAIADMDQPGEKSWSKDSFVKLQTELNATMRDLAPTTLPDLTGPGAPFSTQSPRYGIAFVVVWAIMIFIVAWGTLSHNLGVSIRSSLEELKEDDAGIRIEGLVRSVITGTGALDGSTPDDAQGIIASNFLDSLDQAQEIDEKTYTAVKHATGFLQYSALLYLVIAPFSTIRSLFNFGANPNSLEKSICAETRQGFIAGLYSRLRFDDNGIVSTIRHHDVEGLSLTCMRGFNYHLRDYPPLQEYIDNVGLILNVYGLWLLPAFYGALGASMYHLRRTLNPTLPTPPLLRTVNRTILGSFAGIVIAWFWAPAAQANAETINVGFNLFVVAFLIGYSIDIFFTFLDRVLVTATGSIKRLGTTEK